PHERAQNTETGLVEVVQQQQLNTPFASQPVRELTGRCYRHALRGHDGDVIALGELHTLEQRHEAFLLNVQQGAEAAIRPARDDTGASKPRSLQLQRMGPVEIVAHGKGTETDHVPGMRFNEMATIVKNHVPGRGQFLVLSYEVWQQALGEILTVQL